MPLSRSGAKLLKQVGGKTHATDEDHESSSITNAAPLPTPPNSSRPKGKSNARHTAAVVIQDEEIEEVKEKEVREEDDPERDPESSEGEDMVGGKQRGAGFVTMKAKVWDHECANEGAPGLKPLRRPTDLGTGISSVKKGTFQKPSITTASLTCDAPPAGRRVLSDADLEESEDEDLKGFRSSQSQPSKKRKTFSNLHAPPRTVYGKTQKELTERRMKDREKAEQKQKRKASKSADAERNSAAIPVTFKRRDLPAFSGAGTTAGAAKCTDGSSSPLSSLSVSPEPDSMSIVCETCNERVDKLLKEEYHDEYVKGKSWNIQWQERFCQWHSAVTAKETWQKRGYPNIEWSHLERRMRQHNDFLLLVLRDKVKSHYRDEYAAKVRAKSMSNGFKDAAIKPGATVGYYGPKGEKAMFVCLEF